MVPLLHELWAEAATFFPAQSSRKTPLAGHPRQGLALWPPGGCLTSGGEGVLPIPQIAYLSLSLYLQEAAWLTLKLISPTNWGLGGYRLTCGHTPMV